jgi:HSP20 family protein
MSLIRYEPWSLVGQFHKDLDRLFESRFPLNGEHGQSVSDWVPAADIREEQDRFVLLLDVPGVEPDAIDVSMENGTLTIRGERKTGSRTEGDGYRRVERVAGTFFRRFSLPDTANEESVTARTTNGVLEVVIPKQERVLPRRISVEVA